MSGVVLKTGFGRFNIGRTTATGATAYKATIPPFGRLGVLPGTLGPVKPFKGIVHITDFQFVVPTTAQIVTFMRPLNYTWFSAAAAASQAVVNVYDNPGTFSANYKYGVPNGQAVTTADETVTSGDIVVYQAAGGQWVTDTISSISTLAFTLNTNLPTGGVLQNGLLYYFGSAPSTNTTPTDPWTNAGQPQLDVLQAASNTANYTIQSTDGFIQAFHEGDPMVVYVNNATAQSYIEVLSGYYYKA